MGVFIDYFNPVTTDRMTVIRIIFEYCKGGIILVKEIKPFIEDRDPNVVIFIDQNFVDNIRSNTVWIIFFIAEEVDFLRIQVIAV